MNTATAQHPTEMSYAAHRPGFFARSEAWLDERGKGAWIAAMVLGFVLFWPVGLALLFYMIWSKNMFSKSCAPNRNAGRYARHAMKSTGNAAFDAYKMDTLRRLEDEQTNFENFLERLREAKDKAEFDQFMDERAAATDVETDSSDDAKPA